MASSAYSQIRPAPKWRRLHNGNATKPARFGSATIHIARSAVASPDGAGWSRHFGRVCLSRIGLVCHQRACSRSRKASPEIFDNESVRKAAVICLSMFVLALVANLPFCVTSVVVEEDVGGRNATVCRYFWPEWSVPEFAEKARRLYLTSLGFLLPLSFNFTLYVLIIRKLRRQDAFRSAATRQRDNDTKMAAFVTASFVCLFRITGHKIGDMSRVRTRDLWGVSRTRYRLRHTTPLVVCTGPFHMYNFIRAVSDINISEYGGDYHLFKMTNLRLDCKV
ncbi:hypothetical protein Bbelb_071840 [Branchiostoma belcheri]|nr:hypothetical protein Bbelb_071840 [Branchiostoma belcheri]